MIREIVSAAVTVRRFIVAGFAGLVLATVACASACRPEPVVAAGATAEGYEARRPEQPRWLADRGSALLVLDMQSGLMPIESQEAVFGRIRSLVEAADAAGAEVYWINTESPLSPKGSPGYELAAPLASLAKASHRSLSKSGANAFSGTGLIGELKESGAGRLVLCGIASDQCLNTSVRSAAELGYRVVVASDAHSVMLGRGDSGTIEAINDEWAKDARIEVMPASLVDFDSRPLEARGLGSADWRHSEGFSRFLDERYRLLLTRTPETATQLGLSAWAGLDDTALDGLSPEYNEESERLERETLAALDAYDAADMTAGDRLSADACRRALSDSIALRAFSSLEYRVNPTVFGISYSTEGVFADIHPLDDEADATSYLARLYALEGKLDEAAESLTLSASEKALAPRAVLEPSLAMLRKLGGSAPKATVFYQRLALGLASMPGMDADRSRSMLAEADRVIRERVLPAYARLADQTSAVIGKAPDRIGIWKLPRGDDYYAALLRAKTTTDLSPEAIHEMGLQSLKKIHADIVKAGSQTDNLRGATAAEVVGKAFRTGGRATQAEALTGYRALLAAAEARSRPLFPDYPAARVVVATAPMGGYYQPGSIDGAKPGAFYVAEGAGADRAGMPTLLYHETIPGHHLQIATSHGLDLPVARKLLYFEAYTEGWALYAERLMAEQGAYADDPAGDIGRLQAEAFRAARLVVDTGIHAKRWPLERAVDFMVDQGLLPRQAARQEVVRYASLPGQATSYYVGFLTFLELRDRAEKELGDAFSLAAFHRTVLSCGPVPFAVLGRVVDRWIGDAKAERLPPS